jgi:8-oxo-dGTP pyrophosphatase MutT (NUDIX family)
LRRVLVVWRQRQAERPRLNVAGDTWFVGERESGVAIVVWRQLHHVEVLLLHRSRFGVDFDGEWAWTTPGGGRGPEERPQEAAARELLEETGLRLMCEPVVSPTAAAQRDFDVSVFAARVHDATEVRLSEEHDRYEWVLPEQLTRCQPAWVHAMYLDVLDLVQ